MAGWSLAAILHALRRFFGFSWVPALVAMILLPIFAIWMTAAIPVVLTERAMVSIGLVSVAMIGCTVAWPTCWQCQRTFFTGMQLPPHTG
jgi:hypothetical protein